MDSGAGSDVNSCKPERAKQEQKSMLVDIAIEYLLSDGTPHE
jgi:hypothetical protein